MFDRKDEVRVATLAPAVFTEVTKRINTRTPDVAIAREIIFSIKCPIVENELLFGRVSKGCCRCRRRWSRAAQSHRTHRFENDFLKTLFHSADPYFLRPNARFQRDAVLMSVDGCGVRTWR